MYFSKKLGKNIILRIVLMLAISIVACTLVYNDFTIYKRPIARVEHLTEKQQEPKNIQSIEVKLMNTNSKDKTLTLINKYDVSEVYDEKYHVGDFVFLNGKMNEIVGVKRDYLIMTAVMLLISMLVILGGKKGMLAAICLLINAILFYLIILAYIQGINILLLTIFGSTLFAFIVLALINGINKNMFASFVATIIVTSFVCLIALISIWSSNIDYDFLDFIPEPYTRNQANQFFMSQIIIGCLGAAIDVAVTITAATSEIINKNPKIHIKELMHSARAVADDITGTMINVILFTNIAAIIPTFIISLANGIEYRTVFRFDAYFDLVRFLMGAIAILVAIPVSVLISAFLLRKGRELR